MVLPLGSTFKATIIWNGVLEKMERCLASWKRMYGGFSLKDNFQELYSIACNKDASVAKLLSPSRDSYY